MEWGPRAWHRSILAIPPAEYERNANARIKHRECFRPFALRFSQSFQSAILHTITLRRSCCTSRYSATTRAVCAVNHVDNTGRLQSVSRDENPLYYDLIKAFHRRTGLPVVLNTSFNENEPIVCTPEEAIDCFRRTKMDVLAIGSHLVLKKDNLRNVEEPSAVDGNPRPGDACRGRS